MRVPVLSLCVWAWALSLCFAGERENAPIAASPTEKSPSPKPESPRTRSLKELIALVLAEGNNHSFSAAMSHDMGFGQNETPAKTLRYKRTQTPDKKQHSVAVVVKSSAEGERQPVAVIFAVIGGTKIAGKWHVDGINFLASLDGKLQKAIRNWGPEDEINSESLSTSRKIKKQFEQEKAFFLKDAPVLGLELSR